MNKIDKAIFDTNQVICENISNFSVTDRGLTSQNILSQLRNLVEYIFIKIHSNGADIDPNTYESHKEAEKVIKGKGNLRFLFKFREMLQKSVSHYTLDKDGSERLMLKYYEHLLKLKLFMKKTYNLNILENIDDFPLDTDTELLEYYTKIAQRIQSPSPRSTAVKYNERYYVQKIKPFFIEQKIYYEITFTAVNSTVSKFDRVIAFTNKEIIGNYAVKFSIHNDIIKILDKEMSILIIDDYDVSIRQCELKNFSKILGISENYSTISNEYNNLMRFIKFTRLSLTELLCSDTDFYNYAKSILSERTKVPKILTLLDACRIILINNKPGNNVLRYLLYKMNNQIIKLQYHNNPCNLLSNLYLKIGCNTFETMPFCSSLCQHNPKIFDLLESIPSDKREHEFLARFIKNNTEIEGNLFTLEKDIDGFENIDNLIKIYNNKVYRKHTGRKIQKYKNYLYIESYVEDTTNIIHKLQELSSSGISDYASSVESWLFNESYNIDDESKEIIIKKMFSNSHVALIYGAAGTGKSTLLKHISNKFASWNKIYLANTHPAIDNLRRKINIMNSHFNTIASFLSDYNYSKTCDILFIDECSTVSNDDMCKILNTTSFELLVLVGDIHQIESIYFGNWFSIARKFIPSTSVFELSHPYRTQNKELLTIWDRVRNLDDSILEPLVKNDCVCRLNETLFDRNDSDEIILCLNYDGLYGINNINRFLQNSNPQKEVVWGINTYKVGDPILFNESKIFSPLIHNNTKGWITSIIPEDDKITFNIELDENISFNYLSLLHSWSIKI